jgi:L-alanine-DL-glutamate epimerase-like enolase superfamily enzyme
LSLPLCEPYHLSYRSIHGLDSVWVKIELANGGIGWGESTPLPGYTESDLNAVWTATNNLASDWVGKEAHALLAEQPRRLDGFLFTAVWTALEEATGAIPQLFGNVPLVGLVQEKEGESPKNALQRVRKLSYKVFKLKVGFLPLEEDILRLRTFQYELANDERIRVDANQSLTEAGAAMLLAGCIPGKIELFEQPLPVGAWDECARLARLAPVSIMLDESITDLDSLDRTAESGAANIVKLKWMKQGGMFFLREMVERARRLNLRIVLGNGVAGWIDNRHEAIFWLEHLQDMQLAGEMNGYLKIMGDSTLLGFANGCLSIPPTQATTIEPDSYHPSALQIYRD